MILFAPSFVRETIFILFFFHSFRLISDFYLHEIVLVFINTKQIFCTLNIPISSLYSNSGETCVLALVSMKTTIDSCAADTIGYLDYSRLSYHVVSVNSSLSMMAHHRRLAGRPGVTQMHVNLQPTHHWPQTASIGIKFTVRDSWLRALYKKSSLVAQAR